MLGRTHQIIGVTAGLATYLSMAQPTYGPATFAACIVAAHIAALLPDIDQPASTLWRSLPGGRIAGELVNPFLQHRNLTHSLLGCFLVCVGLVALLGHLPPYWNIDGHMVLIVSLVAYGSHLLADAVTVEGIPLLWPLGKMYGIPPRPFDGIRIVTGQWFENWLVFPAANIALIGLIIGRWHMIQAVIFR